MKKIAVITGASRGIGHAIALKYAEMGFDLAICCRSEKAALERTAKEVRSFGVQCLTFTGDMGSFSAAEQFFALILKTYGHIDILINNAGISYVGLLQEMSPENWNQVISSNLSSVFHCSRLVIPPMLARKSGKILSISSIWGETGASMEVAYSASKGGVNAFTRALAKELAPSNIQVNAIACGVIDTSMNHFLSEEERAQLIEEIPAGRMGTCEEVAELVYQINQKNDYLTGQVITFDGGFI